MNTIQNLNNYYAFANQNSINPTSSNINNTISHDTQVLNSADNIDVLKDQIELGTNNMLYQSTGIQAGLLSTMDGENSFQKNGNDYHSFLEQINYTGTPLTQLSAEEATSLIAKDGMFGVNKTSQRLADYVMNNANGNHDLALVGREVLNDGLQNTQDIFGSAVSNPLQQTIQASRELLDNKMFDSGIFLLDTKV